MNSYPSKIEQQMQQFYHSLSEKDRRRYAAIEALKLGWGGITYISRLFGCDYYTIKFGIKELDDPSAMNLKSIRRNGGGRKSAFSTIKELDEVFIRVIANYTAGSPMKEEIKWTNLTRVEIAQLLKEEGIKVSVTVVDQLLKKHNYRQRKAQKRKSTGEHPQRNQQFENIQQLKKSEKFHTDYTDLKLNLGYIQIGTSHDTSQFACDSIRYWWQNYGIVNYPYADSILLLCDGGGSNSSRQYLFNIKHKCVREYF